MNPSKKANIIGGSIGGLFAANLLLRAGWDVHIYEQVAAELESRGAGIVTHPELLDALREAGVVVDDSLGIQVNSPQHEYASSLLSKENVVQLGGTTQYFNLNPIQNKFTKDFKNVFFEVNAAQLTRASFVELDALVNYLESSANATILIEGHTDNTGTDIANMNLSEKRANAIAQYLISKGIVKERIATKGFGASKPIADNNTQAGRAKNRRTSFTITIP